MLIQRGNLKLRALEPWDNGAVSSILQNQSAANCLFGFPSKALYMGLDAWRHEAAHRKYDFYFAAEEADSQKVSGICAYQDIDYLNGRVTIWAATAPEFPDGPELLSLLAGAAFAHLRTEHVSLLCMAHDTRMAASAEQAGFSRDAVFYSRVKNHNERYDLLVYTLLVGEGRR